MDNNPPRVDAFLHEGSSTVSYVVSDPGSDRSAIIDACLDFDQASGRTSTASAERIRDFVRARGRTVEVILETHIHADHISAAPFLKRELGAMIAIGEHVREVQATWKTIFNVERSFSADGTQFDRLLADNEEFRIGNLAGVALHTPGHTPACMSYYIGDAVFVGDTLFMPDSGTARCDFPGGNAHTMYRSIARILALPPETRVFICHDYAPGGREHRWESTVGEQRALNKHVREGISEEEYVAMRTERDATLGMPTLIIPSVQVNMRAGKFPPAEDNGVTYLKIPIDLL
ncbi:MAG: MBL fold metallo-hydrolase [Proteobacteria bacterium]|nr:MBL fold metallo-hydrolase [Pseudomonadota bacterium]